MDTSAGHIRITVSIGVSCNSTSTSLADAIRQVDTMMYKAKRSGRNRVECTAS